MVIDMTRQEAAVYKEIQKNTDTALKTIETIAGKAYDDEFSRQLSEQSIRFSEIHNEASKQLMAAKASMYQGSVLSDAMLKTGIHYNTMLNTSTGHLAELMIKENNNGIIEMEKILKHNENAGSLSVKLAKQLINFEEKNVVSLKQFL